jgi:hypothetical protein
VTPPAPVSTRQFVAAIFPRQLVEKAVADNELFLHSFAKFKPVSIPAAIACNPRGVLKLILLLIWTKDVSFFN